MSIRIYRIMLTMIAIYNVFYLLYNMIMIVYFQNVGIINIIWKY